MAETQLKKTFSTGDIATLIGVSVQTVAKMIDNGDIQGFKLPGGFRRVTRQNLVTYLLFIGNNDALQEIGE